MKNSYNISILSKKISAISFSYPYLVVFIFDENNIKNKKKGRKEIYSIRRGDDDKDPLYEIPENISLNCHTFLSSPLNMLTVTDQYSNHAKLHLLDIQKFLANPSAFQNTPVFEYINEPHVNEIIDMFTYIDGTILLCYNTQSIIYNIYTKTMITLNYRKNYEHVCMPGGKICVMYQDDMVGLISND
jgi:hypothetical protein